jgi:hypothetical protein
VINISHDVNTKPKHDHKTLSWHRGSKRVSDQKTAFSSYFILGMEFAYYNKRKTLSCAKECINAFAVQLVSIADSVFGHPKIG